MNRSAITIAFALAILVGAAVLLAGAETSGAQGVRQGFLGDVNCDLDISPADALDVLIYDAGFALKRSSCPQVGSSVTASRERTNFDLVWGDVNCDDLVNPIDSFHLLKYDIGDPEPQTECPDVGTPFRIPEQTTAETIPAADPGSAESMIVESVGVQPDHEVDVRVMLTAEGVGAWRFDLHYDSRFMTAVDCSFFAGYCSVDAVNEETVRVSATAFGGLDADDLTLGDVTFAAGQTSVITHVTVKPETLVLTDTRGRNLLPVDVTDGTVTIGDAEHEVCVGRASAASASVGSRDRSRLSAQREPAPPTASPVPTCVPPPSSGIEDR